MQDVEVLQRAELPGSHEQSPLCLSLDWSKSTEWVFTGIIIIMMFTRASSTTKARQSTPTLKNLKLASLVSSNFFDCGLVIIMS